MIRVITTVAFLVCQVGTVLAQSASTPSTVAPSTDQAPVSQPVTQSADQPANLPADQPVTQSTVDLSAEPNSAEQPTINAAAADWSAALAAAASFDPEAMIAPVSGVEGPGIKIGESTVVHPVVGVMTGYVSNVFYTSSNPQPSGILRLMAQISAGSLSQQRLTPLDGSEGESNPGFRYHADARATYDSALSGNDAVNGTSGLGLGASFHGVVNPAGNLSLTIDEDFARVIRAVNFESNVNTNRDINSAQVSLLYHPRNRAVSASLYYTNSIDVFERSQQQFADYVVHQIGLRPMWQFLPVSQLYLDVSQAYSTGLGTSSSKVTSYPLVAKVGIATLLSLKTTLNFEAGYTNGFYASGPSFSAPLVNLELGYRYSPLGRASVGYSYNNQDSINANFYRDHVIHGMISQVFQPVMLVLQPELHFRQYNGITLVNGPPQRNDTVVSIVAGVNYNFRNWLAATVGYRYTSVQTDYRYMVGASVNDPSYARHEALAGMRVAF